MRKQQDMSLEQRNGTITASLGNVLTEYLMDVTLGSSAQIVQVQLSTGTGDTWVMSASSAYCQQNACDLISFDPTQSSSFKPLQFAFNSTYHDGAGSSGIYFADTLSIGNVALTGAVLGLANITTKSVMGLSFTGNGADSLAGPLPPGYPTILEQMVTQSKINSRAFSLWLNDREASAGSILFGAIDTGSFVSPLLSIPMGVSTSIGYRYQFIVGLTSLTETTPNIVVPYTSGNFSEQVVLDAGAILTVVPDDIFKTFETRYEAAYNSTFGFCTISCEFMHYQASFHFQFGGSAGPLINISLTELILPEVWTNGTDCAFGILPAYANNGILVFGDSFLRGAYVVYDLDAMQISLANTKFNSTGGDVIAIPAGGAGVSNITPTTTAATTTVSTIVTGVMTAAETSGNFTGGAQNIIGATVTTTGQEPVSTASSGSAIASPTSGSSRAQARAHGSLGFVAWIGWIDLFMLGFVSLL